MFDMFFLQVLAYGRYSLKAVKRVNLHHLDLLLGIITGWTVNRVNLGHPRVNLAIVWDFRAKTIEYLSDIIC